MSKILGLDLGSNSIGWALVDSSQKKIIDLGCRIFPMGVNLEKKVQRKFQKMLPDVKNGK